MFNRTNTFEINCDAPPYAIVQACRVVGIRDPEDVRWCRRSESSKQRHPRVALFDPRSWKGLFGTSEVAENVCNCGRSLPALEEYTFTYSTGSEVRYLIGQCPRCRTIYWEEPCEVR